MKANLIEPFVRPSQRRNRSRSLQDSERGNSSLPPPTIAGEKPKPFLEKWGVLITLMSLLVTSVLTVYQLRIQNHALTTGAFNDLDQRNFQIQRLLFDKPNLYPYFYTAGADLKDLKSPDDITRVRLIAEMFLDFMEAFHNAHIYSLPGMEVGGESWTIWDNYFRDLFAASQALCQVVKAKPTWWSSPRTAHHSKNTCKAPGSGATTGPKGG